MSEDLLKQIPAKDTQLHAKRDRILSWSFDFSWERRLEDTLLSNAGLEGSLLVTIILNVLGAVSVAGTWLMVIVTPTTRNVL